MSLLNNKGARGYDRICLVGHSFGTHIIAHALQELSTDIPNVDLVILSGSVLPTRYPWNLLLRHRVSNVVNDCGTEDTILPLNALLPFGSGVGGRTGFQGLYGQEFCNRFFKFGHSGYFIRAPNRPSGQDQNWFMARYLVPLLLGEPIELADERDGTAAVGIMTSLANRSEGYKWVMPVVALAMLFAAGHHLGTLNLQRQLAEAAAAAATIAEDLQRKRAEAESKQRQDSELQKRQEREVRFRSVGRNLAANSLAETARGDAVTGMLLAIEAASVADSASALGAEETRALYTAVMQNREIASSADKPIKWIIPARTPRLAILERGHAVRLLDRTGRTIAEMANPTNGSSLAASLDGKLIAIGGQTIGVW